MAINGGTTLAIQSQIESEQRERDELDRSLNNMRTGSDAYDDASGRRADLNDHIAELEEDLKAVAKTEHGN